MRKVLVLACVALTASILRAAKPGPFVLTDPGTGLPILSCVVPDGWVAGGQVLWIRNPNQPVRYFATATDPRTGDRMVLGSTVTFMPRNPYTRLDQAADITVPSQVARRLADEIAGLYGIRGLCVSSAMFSPYDAKTAKPFVDRRVADARRSLINLTRCDYGLLRIRYVGQVGGRPRVVNCSAPYCLLELNGVSSLGEILRIDSCLSSKEGEKAAIARMTAFAGTRQLCPGFERFCSQIIQKNTMIMVRSQSECLDIFLRAAGESSRRISAANARWCDAIRGEERVVNPATGRETFISTQYDHCRFGANGEVLYWNGAGATAGFDPGVSPAFSHTTWTAPKR